MGAEDEGTFYSGLGKSFPVLSEYGLKGSLCIDHITEAIAELLDDYDPVVVA